MSLTQSAQLNIYELQDGSGEEGEENEEALVQASDGEVSGPGQQQLRR